MPKWSFRLQNKLQTKAEVRKILRAKRTMISAEKQIQAAEAARMIFSKSDLFQNAKHIAGYQAHGSEFSLELLAKLVWEHKKNYYLPVLSSHENKVLSFISFDKNDPLHLNQYNILEPIYDAIKEIPAINIDVVMVPLIAFDKNGYRLGSGSGYYDRTFSFLKNKEKLTKPFFIGVGYAMQEVESIVHDEWDVPLDGVLTETNLIVF